MLVKFTAQ